MLSQVEESKMAECTLRLCFNTNILTILYMISLSFNNDFAVSASNR